MRQVRRFLSGLVPKKTIHKLVSTVLFTVALYCFHVKQTRSSFRYFMAEECTGRGPEVHRLLQSLHDSRQRRPEKMLEVNMSGPSWRLWSEDAQGSSCVNYETRLGRDLPRVWLASFPCSGNTWVRYLLEGASGIFTGSVYSEEYLYRAGFRGEMELPDSGRTLVQKTHGCSLFGNFEHDLLCRYDEVDPNLPTVLILRNPARAIISYWKLYRGQAGPDTTNKSLDIFTIPEFPVYVEDAVSLWEEFATDRLMWSTGPLHVLHYEHLLTNTSHYLRKLLHFLSVPVDEGRLACVSSHPDGSFKRTSNRKFDPFTQKDKQRMASAVKRVKRLLLLSGYPEPPSYKMLPELP